MGIVAQRQQQLEQLQEGNKNMFEVRRKLICMMMIAMDGWMDERTNERTSLRTDCKRERV